MLKWRTVNIKVGVKVCALSTEALLLSMWLATTSMYNMLMESKDINVLKQKTVNMKVGVKVRVLSLEALLLFMCGLSIRLSVNELWCL